MQLLYIQYACCQNGSLVNLPKGAGGGFKSVFVDHGTVARADVEVFYPDFYVKDLRELLSLELMK